MTPHVLLVEDEPLIAMAVQAKLEDEGLTSELAVNGDAALEALDRMGADFSALLVDIRLPKGPDGWAVARHARELHPTIAVIYASGDSSPHWEVNGVPGSVMLSKPYALSELTQALMDLLHEQGKSVSS